MTTPEDDPLIEALARAACEDERIEPDAIIDEAIIDGVKVVHVQWHGFMPEARRHLAMQRAYERTMKELHEAWTHEMIASAPKIAETEIVCDTHNSEQNDNCDHAWEIDADGLTSTDASVANTFRCKKCGTRQRYI